MGGIDQIEIVHAECFHFLKKVTKCLYADDLPCTLVTNRGVLTKHASKGASAKENRPTALASADAGFFPCVRVRSCHHWKRSHSTKALSDGIGSERMALPWAERTFDHPRIRSFPVKHKMAILGSSYE